MSRHNFLSSFLSFIGWLTGAIVSFAVAFGMIYGTLTIKFIPQIIMVIFGWIVIITTLIGMWIAVMKFILTRHARSNNMDY